MRIPDFLVIGTFLFAVAIGVLVGCALEADTTSIALQEPVEAPLVKGREIGEFRFATVSVLEDKDHGVVCYEYQASTMRSFSCVPVANLEKVD